jgi:cold shock CspA family protein
MRKFDNPFPRNRDNGRFVRVFKGHVKRYFPDVQMGTIIGDNGLSYAFAHSEWLSQTEDPKRGQPVTFQLNGDRAKKIEKRGEESLSVENTASP